jgi:hypothetical protein
LPVDVVVSNPRDHHASFGLIREAAGFPRMLQVSARLAW